MDKEDEVHIYNEIPLSHKKKNVTNAIYSNREGIEIIITSEIRKRKIPSITYM